MMTSSPATKTVLKVKNPDVIDKKRDVINMSFEQQMEIACQESLKESESAANEERLNKSEEDALNAALLASMSEAAANDQSAAMTSKQSDEEEQLKAALMASMYDANVDGACKDVNGKSEGDAAADANFELDGMMDFAEFATPISDQTSVSASKASKKKRYSSFSSTASSLSPPSTEKLGKRMQLEFPQLSSSPSKDTFKKENENIGEMKREEGHELDYRLTAVVSHLGATDTIEKGHYVADVYNFKKESWYHYNDSCVSKREMGRVAKDNLHDGYIFIYTHHREAERKPM